jgi:nucleoside phosphorylase
MDRQNFTVGWICAVKTEFVAACELLDEEYLPLTSVPSHDSNTYTLGRMGDHHVVVACLPKGRYGIASAATVAKDMLRSFESIRVGLMVGIGGGAPSKKHDIRLGDVVVGCPVGRTGGVLHYNFGKAVQGKDFEITGSLNSPPMVLLTALNQLDAFHERKGNRIAETVQKMVTRNPRVREKYEYPGAEKDRWYESSFTHVDNNVGCDIGCGCTVQPVIQRQQRSSDPENPVVHYGTIASADQLMKDALARDRISQQHGVLCFEMEAAGLSNDLPCIVIRGICDYSDSHKNDEWQGYAAATAASYAKELLQTLPKAQVVGSQRAIDVLSDSGECTWAESYPLKDKRHSSHMSEERIVETS